MRRNKRKKYQYGGKVKVDFPMPEVQHGTTQDALKAQQEATKQANDENKRNRYNSHRSNQW